MAGSAPHNIIVGIPFEAWLAPRIGDTPPVFPPVDEDVPTGVWQSIGANGSQDYDNDGVSVEHTQTLNYHTFLGSTAPRKVSRSEEGMRIEMTVHDMTLETYAQAIGQTVTDVEPAAGTVGTKAIGFARGFEVAQYSLLVRGPSPYMDAYMQYEVPVVIIDGEPNPVYNKTDPAGLVLSFVALEDPDATSVATRYGRLIAQYAPAT